MIDDPELRRMLDEIERSPRLIRSPAWVPVLAGFVAGAAVFAAGVIFARLFIS